MKVTLTAQNRVIQKQRKASFAAHIKGLKLKDKQNACISNNLKTQISSFDPSKIFNNPQIKLLSNQKKFQFLRQKCKLSNKKSLSNPNQSIKQYSTCSNTYKQKKINNNPQIYEQRIKAVTNQIYQQNLKEQNHSTKANSKQKSRATSVDSSTNCCKFVKIQREEVIISGSNKKSQIPIHEKKLKDKKKKISKILSPQITKITRIIMLDWMFQLSAQIQLPKQALYNAIDYIDKFVSESEVKKAQYQKVGLACLFLATKLQMSSHPRIQIFLQAMDNQMDRQVLIDTEKTIVHALKFRLNPPTLYQYMTVAMMTIKTFKSEYKNIGWVNDLPSIQKGNEIYKKMHWIMDGVIIEGALTHKYGKDEICLSIIYISMLIFVRKLKIFDNNGQKIKSIDAMRHQSTAYSQISFSSFERSTFSIPQEEQKFNLSYECFIRYATTSNKSLKDYKNCIIDLEKWKISQCSCFEFNSDYHEELKHLALAK